jgi:hypothetical protein
MIKSSDLLIFLEKTNLSSRFRFVISSTHLIISIYHSTVHLSIFQQIIHVDMKIIDQKMIEWTMNKINDHYFSILNEIKWDNECFNIREIIWIWGQWQRR